MTGAGRDDGGRGPGDADRGGDPWSDLPPVAGIVVPDDPSGLEDDVRAWRREVSETAREQLRQQRQARRTGSSSRLRRLGLSVPMLVSVLCAITLVGLFTLVLGPERAPLGPSRPLATGVPTTGEIGARLPEVILTAGSGIPVATELLRPAVLVLVPTPCDEACAAAVREVTAQSRSLEVPSALVVATDATDDDTASLASAAQTETVLSDSTGLARELGADGVTAVVIGADGVVVDIVRGVQSGQRLESRIRPVSPAT